MKIRFNLFCSVIFLALMLDGNAYALELDENIFIENNDSAQRFLKINEIHTTRDIIWALDNTPKSKAMIWIKVGERFRRKKNDDAQSRAMIIYYHLLLDEKLSPNVRSMAAIGLSKLYGYKSLPRFAEQAVELDPGNGYAYLRLAELQATYKEKLKNYKIALTLSTINRDKHLRLKALFRLAIISARNGEQKEAQKYWAEAEIIYEELEGKRTI